MKNRFGKKYKKFTVVTDHKMRWQGDTDDDNKIIRINPTKSKKKSTLIDTIVHEKLHADHKSWTEKKVYKEAPIRVKKLSKNKKNKLYKLIT